MGSFDTKKEIIYNIKTPGNGMYVFVLEGVVKINNTMVNKRDALGVYDTSSITIETEAESRLLIMDVLML
jgi:hypothetical protein